MIRDFDVAFTLPSGARHSVTTGGGSFPSCPQCKTFWSCLLHCPCLFRRSPGMLFVAIGFSFASPSLRFVKQVSGEEPYSNTSRIVRLFQGAGAARLVPISTTYQETKTRSDKRCSENGENSVAGAGPWASKYGALNANTTHTCPLLLQPHNLSLPLVRRATTNFGTIPKTRHRLSSTG